MSAINWEPASFYRPQGDRLLCTLCPHACALADGETGFCQVRRRTGFRLETTCFASAVLHLDNVERKPFYHYRPGRKALTLAPSGCSFTCLYCQNYRLSQFGRVPDAPWRTVACDPEELVATASQQNVAIALSYSEPTLAAELTLALAAASRGKALDILWKTNGFITLAALERLAPCLTAVNVDFKAADEGKHRALTGAPLAPVLEAIAAFLAAGIWVEISTPLIPKFNDSPDSLRRLAATVRTFGASIPWHLLRFNPDFRLHHVRPTSVQTLSDALGIARAEGLPYVYVERACGPVARNTFCPCCGDEVVTRGIWETLTVNLRAGACPACGFVIPGRWHG